MSRQIFTPEQQQLLRQNPYIYSVTETRFSLTKEFKEIYLEAYRQGESPRKILEDHGFDINLIGDRRIWSISNHIRTEYKKYGEFHEGYRPRSARSEVQPDIDKPLSEADEIRQLRHEVNYMKQEIEFLKKISSIKNTRK